jgi:hypothetical protein
VKKEKSPAFEFIDDKAKKDLLNKTWYVSLFKDNQYVYYGPLSSKKVYFFLKNVYIKLKSETERKNFLIVDYERDIHFQPDTLYELLTESISLKSIEDEEVSYLKNLEAAKKKKELNGQYYLYSESYSSNSTTGSDDGKSYRKKHQSRIKNWTK